MAEGLSYAQNQNPKNPRPAAVPWVSDEVTEWHPGKFFVIQRLTDRGDLRTDTETGHRHANGSLVAAESAVRDRFRQTCGSRFDHDPRQRCTVGPMTHAPGNRVDAASRVIKASPRRIYEAFMDPKALVSWLPPKGMKAHIDTYESREGGIYQITLVYDEPDHSAPGKTSEDSDVVRGRFLELIPNRRIVELVEFESADPAFAGEMKMTWTLTSVPEGTEVARRGLWKVFAKCAPGPPPQPDNLAASARQQHSRASRDQFPREMRARQDSNLRPPA
jgi:uncharacterized protein YndB with AHSA1/START domain